MLIYEIHYTINGFDDYCVVSGDSIEEIQEIAKNELRKRNVDINTAWSKPIKGLVKEAK